MRTLSGKSCEEPFGSRVFDRCLHGISSFLPLWAWGVQVSPGRRATLPYAGNRLISRHPSGTGQSRQITHSAVITSPGGGGCGQ